MPPNSTDSATSPSEETTGPAEIDDFPYWAHSFPPAAAMFAALAKDRARVTMTAAGPVLARTYPADHHRCDGLSNHYTEAARLPCRMGGGVTLREAWARVRPGAPGASMTDLSKTNPSNEELREQVYRAGRECNIFNPAFARWILESLAGPGARVLDPSAGWGDRLLGALAAGAACYHGFDPNPRLQEGHRRIVAELGRGDHEAFRTAPAPFEEAELEPDSYDVAFTSPPYFTLEVYVEPGAPGEKAQSVAPFDSSPRGYAAWLGRWYRPYLARAYRAVRPGGWVVLYVEDFRMGRDYYPFRADTAAIMAALGAEKAMDFGLVVSPDAPPRAAKKRVHQRARAPRFALSWRKPPGAPADGLVKEAKLVKDKSAIDA